MTRFYRCHSVTLSSAEAPSGYPNKRLLNQPKAMCICICSINQSNRSFCHLLFLFCSCVFISKSYENCVIFMHRRTGNFLPWVGGGGGVGGGKPLAQKILRSCPNFYETYSRKETRAILCNNIGRTGIWRWFDTETVFQGQYLPILTITTSP